MSRLLLAVLAATLVSGSAPSRPTGTTGAVTDRGRQRLTERLEARVLADLDRDQWPAARALLADPVLSWQLRGLATSPFPEQLVDAVQDGITRRLDARPAAERLQALGEYTCGVAAMRNLEDAVLLAVSRFVRDRGDPGPGAGYWTAPARRRYGSLSDRALAERVTALSAEVDRWQAQADRRYPGCSRARLQNLLDARSALAAAGSGRFDQASGSLHQFVTRALP